MESSLSRRTVVGGATLGLAATVVPAQATPALSKTYVLAHGSWHGGWCWQRVAERLRAQGHRVFTPSYTGMGDREHLLTRDITIETFVRDIAEVIKTEELSDVILVGHSFGGVPITGVADRMPDRLRHLVYLDAIVLESGKTAFSSYPQHEVDERIAISNKVNGGLAVPNPKSLSPSWGFAPGTPDYEWVMRRITPTPLRAYMTALELRGPIGNGVPKTYVHCLKPENPVIEPSRRLVKSMSGWAWIDFPGPHDAMITDPDGVAKILLQV